MTTRLMRDSTKLADIPVHGTDIVAPYVNGLFASTEQQVRARFPHIPVAWIDVNGTHPAADVLDVETGDATPAGAVLWVKAKRALQLGATHTLYPPVLYCNRATLTPLFNAMHAAGYRVVQDFRLWVATLDGTTHLADMTGVTAVQARGEAQTGGHYDESVVYDPAWLAPPAPPPAGPVRHVADGTKSLAEIAATRNTTASHLLEVSAGAYTTGDKATLVTAKLPAGVVYYTSR